MANVKFPYNSFLVIMENTTTGRHRVEVWKLGTTDMAANGPTSSREFTDVQKPDFLAHVQRLLGFPVPTV